MVFHHCRNRAKPHVPSLGDATEMNFLSARSLPRRTVLRGLGTTLALPVLDAMLPATICAAPSGARPVHRFQTFYVPNGMAMEHWTPKGEGTSFELSPILEPLTPFRN